MLRNMCGPHETYVLNIICPVHCQHVSVYIFFLPFEGAEQIGVNVLAMIINGDLCILCSF